MTNWLICTLKACFGISHTEADAEAAQWRHDRNVAMREAGVTPPQKFGLWKHQTPDDYGKYLRGGPK